MKLSIIIPVFNEKRTIKKIIDRIIVVKNIKKEIIIVDDGSTDGTKNILKKLNYKEIRKTIFLKKNLGKGAAIRAAKNYITGDIIIIQDADLEYDPQDYRKFIKIYLESKAKVIYGSRYLGKKKYNRNRNFWLNFRAFGNYFLTKYSNFINNQKLTDAHTCYKSFRTDFYKKIKLQENDFAFCPEITTKISNEKIDIIEIPISYNGRTYSQGKKISLKDAFRAIYVVIKYKLKKNNSLL